MAHDAATRAARLAAEARASEERATASAEREAQQAKVATNNAQFAQRMAGVAGVVAILAVVAAIFGWWQNDRAQKAEQARTVSLFESQLTHASLLARVEDYAEARRILAASLKLDPAIPPERRHARNLLAGYVQMMGGQAGVGDTTYS